MPIYEYECIRCGEVTEEIVYLPNEPPKKTKCRVCGTEARRILSTFKMYRVGKHGDKKWK